jgi:N-glycosylase/DNA lyase
MIKKTIIANINMAYYILKVLQVGNQAPLPFNIESVL